MKTIQIVAICAGAIGFAACGSQEEKMSFPVVYKGTYTITHKYSTLNASTGETKECVRTSSTTDVSLTLEEGGSLKYETPKSYIESTVKPGYKLYDNRMWMSNCHSQTDSLFQPSMETYTGSHDSVGSFSFDKPFYACPKKDNPGEYIYLTFLTNEGVFNTTDAQFSGKANCSAEDYYNGQLIATVYEDLEESFSGSLAK